MPKKFTKEDFISKAINIHKNKYDYSKVEYINSRTKIKIICKIHGEFEQLPYVHFTSDGCYTCGRETTRDKNKKGKEQFIKDSVSIYGTKFNYDKVDYLNAVTKVIITCPIHGDILIRPKDHIFKKRSCKHCNLISKNGNRRRGITKNTEDFVSKSIEKHGMKYTYEKTQYINSKDKVIITCTEHGDFEQTPSNHLTGFGCSKCSGTFRYDTESYIEKACQVHNNKYKYDKTIYKMGRSKIIITCPIHGDFEQVASGHLSGNGCSKCGGTEKLTTEIFIQRANKAHKGLYTYEKVKYVNLTTKVKITCPTHGVFEQSPDKHIEGNGCKKCSGMEQSNTNDFIKKSSIIHNNIYNYDKVNYVTAHKIVTITCPEHGDFEITPNRHLNGSGCILCSTGGGYRRTKIGYFYIHNIHDENGCVKYYKFGITNNQRKRFQILSRNNNVTITQFKCFKSDNGEEIINLESFIKSSDIKTKVLEQTSMSDGYTETINVEDLPKLMKIVHKFMNKEGSSIVETSLVTDLKVYKKKNSTK
ncbi:hypothetical protein XaC1_444 [Xanthomonas phage XaC1]|nr:hypothetical protein XaC1_444 [Xanthomonas phage XaC1]